jgi:hypothetical protein
MEEKQIVMTAEQIKGWESRIERVAREIYHKSAEMEKEAKEVQRRVAHGVERLEEKADQIDSLPLEDFQQEFEAMFIDESYSYYPYSLILLRRE